MKNIKKKIFEIGTNIILFFFVPMMVTSLVSLTSNPPKLISASSFEQDICSAIRLEIQRGDIYFPYPHTLEENDTVTFLELIPYNNQIYIGTGYASQGESNYTWCVLLKRVWFSDHYLYLSDTGSIIDNRLINSSMRWFVKTDSYFFTTLTLRIAPDYSHIDSEVHASDNFKQCLGILVVFFIGDRIRKSRRETAQVPNNS